MLAVPIVADPELACEENALLAIHDGGFLEGVEAAGIQDESIVLTILIGELCRKKIIIGAAARLPIRHLEGLFTVTIDLHIPANLILDIKDCGNLIEESLQETAQIDIPRSLRIGGGFQKTHPFRQEYFAFSPYAVRSIIDYEHFTGGFGFREILSEMRPIVPRRSMAAPAVGNGRGRRVVCRMSAAALRACQPRHCALVSLPHCARWRIR